MISLTMYYRGNRRVRLLLAIGAHLVVLGLLFQVAAFDHWSQGFEGVQGVQDSSAHVHASHCHGDVAGCADAGGASANLVSPGAVFAVPASVYFDAGMLLLDSHRPQDAALTAPVEPPKAA